MTGGTPEGGLLESVPCMDLRRYVKIYKSINPEKNLEDNNCYECSFAMSRFRSQGIIYRIIRPLNIRNVRIDLLHNYHVIQHVSQRKYL